MEEHYITGLNLAHYPCMNLVTSRKFFQSEGIYRPLNRLVANGRSCLNDGVVVFAKRRPKDQRLFTDKIADHLCIPFQLLRPAPSAVKLFMWGWE